MILNQSFFQKKSPPCRVHMDDSNASSICADQLETFLTPFTERELVIVCIGTDRSTGDSLGPLIGTKLKENGLSSFTVYGTLEYPVHAVNLEENLQKIKDTHKKPFIIGIDACLGRLNSVGKITVAKGPVKPGAAVNKNLPDVGDIHITGIVNIGGMMEYFVLQNTRLHVVMKMAETIATSIILVDETIKMNKVKRRTFLESLKPTIFDRKQKETNLP